MRKTTLAKRYAEALIDIGREDGSYEQYGEQLRSANTVFESFPELYKVLLNPMYRIETRKTIVEELGKRLGLSQVVVKFLCLLVERRHIRLLEEITKQYSQLEDRLAGRIRVTVEVAEGVEEGLINEVKEKIERESGNRVILKTLHNPDLIGGLIIKIGNTIFDGSIKTQLERMKEKLLEGVSLYV